MPNLELSSKVHPLGGEPYRSEGSKIKQTGQMSSFHETRECQQIVKQVDDCRSSDSQTAGNDRAAHILL